MLAEKERKEIIYFLNQRMSNLNLDDCYVWHDEDGYEFEGHYDDIASSCRADDYAYGCSKLVLFYEALPNWVVKIPFIGEHYEEDNSWVDFQNANRYNLFPIADDNDYCAIEAYLAEEATEYGLEKMFAQTFFLTEINGVKIYLSEKIENDYYSCCCRKYKDKNSARRAEWLRDSYCKTDIEKYVLTGVDLAFFIDAYGLWQTELLIAFLTDYKVEDLHHGNIGFDNNGNIKLIDYSGFSN